MARIYRKIQTSIWNDDKFPFVSDDCQLLFFYMISSPTFSRPNGIFKAPLSGMAEEKRWELERFRQTFREGLGEGFWEYDERFQIIYFPNWWKHNSPENPNVLKSIIGFYDDLPDCKLKAKAIQQLKTFAKGWGEPFAKVTANLSERLGQTFPKQKENKNKKEKDNKNQYNPPSPLLVLPPQNKTVPKAEDIAERMELKASG